MRVIPLFKSITQRDLLAIRIAGRIERSHMLVAGKMSQWFNRLNPSVQKVVLLLITLLVSISLLSGIIFPDRHPAYISTTNITNGLSAHHDLSLKSICKHKN
ncbi:hypothetical protein [Mucilaginibacter ginkgonis]|uniref:Uncharacterized protein n=1 Tax=Mucilaginibacter ginkgonis TaxID=2682091 RepID=A0A6I4IMP1_9SPHI|nr:hypothetical protein [Mucilaginibacter ginkgonis]QQL49961.1 hypothetical protein GO620_000480 [Mucilaginibacter ginkgonis]